MPSTMVKARIEAGGVAVPVDAHMYLQHGKWLWSMTAENLTTCKK